MDRNEEARKKQTEEQIAKMKEAKCQWPGCKEKNMMHVSLQVMKQTEKGLVPADGLMKDAAVPVPLCMYHFGIAQTGLCAAVQHPENKEQFAFIAPVEAVQVAEAVIHAMGFSGKLKEIVNAKDQADQKMKEMEKDIADRKRQEDADKKHMEEVEDANKKANAKQEGNKSADKPGKQ